MRKNSKVLRLGSGSAWERDALENAVVLAEKGNLDYIGFDCLAERTLALAQQRKLEDPTKGYNPLLERRVRAILPICVKKQTKLISNFGAANPEAAASKIIDIIKEMGYSGLTIATVLGDDVRHLIGKVKLMDMETGKPLKMTGELVSANAYLGADPIVEALRNGADIVVTGRVADPSLWMAPMIYEFNWEERDWHTKGAGMLISHIMECAAHCNAGNMAFPGYINVPGLDNLGDPLAEVSPDGEAVITKVEGTGGFVTRFSVKAQIAHEVHDPSAYLTPDVVADFSQANAQQVGKDRVRVFGATGREKPETLKVMVGFMEGYLAEAESSYAGYAAYEKAQLAINERIKPQLAKMGGDILDSRIDIIGVNAIHGPASPKPKVPPWEVRIRLAAKVKNTQLAEDVCDIVDHLMVHGPVAASVEKRQVTPMLAVHPTLISRKLIPTKIIVHKVVLKELAG